MLENGRLSDRYRIGNDTGRIVSNRIGYFCIGRYIAAGSAAVNQLHYTGDQEIKERSRPVTRCARTPLIDHDTGVGMLTATLQPLITCHTPALQPTHQTTEQTAEPGS